MTSIAPRDMALLEQVTITSKIMLARNLAVLSVCRKLDELETELYLHLSLDDAVRRYMASASESLANGGTWPMPP